MFLLNSLCDCYGFLSKKKARHVARTIDILKKVAPDLPEGKTCEKEDLCREVVKKLGKIEKKWAVALTSEQCNLLDDCEKSQLRDWSKSIGGGGGVGRSIWKCG